MARLLVVLFAFVCAFEAAKYKYFIENVGDMAFVDAVYVLHDRNFDLFVDGEKPSKGLLGYIEDAKSTEYLNEIRVQKGVYAVEFLTGLNANLPFYVQSDRNVDRLTLIVRTSSDSSFLAAMGSRLPTDAITSFNGDVRTWSIDSTSLVESSAPNTWLHLSGRQFCPDNDHSVYVKLENVGELNFRKPIFWTQAGGSNDVYWPGEPVTGGYNSLLKSGDPTLLDKENLWNEDVCYSWVASNADLSANGKEGVWEIPVAAGQKLFFAVASPSTPSWIIGSNNAGVTLWKDGALRSAFSVDSDLAAYSASSSKVTVVSSIEPNNFLHAFVFDHFPNGEEFPEESEDITDGYDIGVCGSYVLGDDGIYTPKEWQQHPYDCTDQLGGDKCMFCKGRANDKIRSVCLPRLGNGCNSAFNSPPRSTFCNLEFECPASTVSFSLFLALSLMGVLFFAF